MIYVGCKRDKVGGREVFTSLVTPSIETHGKKYFAAIGPFKTQAGAEFMAVYGKDNPHCRCVEDAEFFAKKFDTFARA